MSTASPLLPHGGYEHLRSYKVAQAVYDATVVFCDRFLDKRSRTHDQMVQAARSGVRNISEGSGAAATSRKSEMLLTNVARASLADELLKDFESFLIQRKLRVWPKDAPEALALRERLKHDETPVLPPAAEGAVRLTGLPGLADFVAEAEPELAANAMLCAIHQAAYLLRRQVESQGRDFVEHGGFSEQFHAVRVQRQKSDGADKSDQAPAPACPLCGKGMQQRTAKTGPHAGQPFWGCSGYPKCKGTREVSDVSDKSDRSDKSDLRLRAEEKAARSPEADGNLPPEAARLALHELRVHQIELEMQNEELCRAQAELGASQALYFDLYDLAPVGYVTIAENGLILEANLTLATLLGVARGELVSRLFSRFLPKDETDRYYLFRKALFSTGEPQACELKMLKDDGTPFWAQLSATAAQGAEGKRVSRIALSDITVRKHAENMLRMALQAAGAGAWDWDMTTDRLCWSSEMFRLFGLDPATATASFETWRNINHPSG